MSAYLPSARQLAQRDAEGEMTLDEAAQQLSEETNGGLTPRGAADVIRDPDAAQKKVVGLMGSTVRHLEKLRTQIDTTQRTARSGKGES